MDSSKVSLQARFSSLFLLWCAGLRLVPAGVALPAAISMQQLRAMEVKSSVMIFMRFRSCSRTDVGVLPDLLQRALNVMLQFVESSRYFSWISLHCWNVSGTDVWVAVDVVVDFFRLGCCRRGNC